MSRIKGTTPAPKPRTCMEFLELWQPKLRRTVDDMIELDFSFRDDAITITDMRIPSALRTGVLYTRKEVEDRVDLHPGDINERIDRFMAQAVGLKK